MNVSVEALVHASLETVWKKWNTPDDIKNWNAASDDWQTTYAKVDLKPGGEFVSRMEAKDGSAGFDLRGTYTTVIAPTLLAYTIEDGRQVCVEFSQTAGGVKVNESFETEATHTIEQQRAGWQAILDNFARYVEAGEDG